MNELDIGTLGDHQAQGGLNALLWCCLVAFGAALAFALIVNGWRQRFALELTRTREGAVAPRNAPRISLLIPARNAEETIVPLLQDLYAQRYPKESMEVIVIDDASEDRTSERVQGLMRTWPELQLLRSVGVGKKAAITTGVQMATGELVILTDADARCVAERVGRIVAHWRSDPADMILLPVFTSSVGGIIGALQVEEQVALLGVAAATAMEGSPLLANGANMAFTKAAFEQVRGYQGDRFASGDDIFLLQRMRRAGKRVSFLLDRGAIVTVQAEPTFRGFWQQRLRWAGKMRGVSGGGSWAGAIALLLPLFLFYLTCSFSVKEAAGQGLFRCSLLLASAWLLWLLPVLGSVQEVKRFLGLPSTAVRTTGALVAFTIYAPVIAFASLFARPLWKGRRS